MHTKVRSQNTTLHICSYIAHVQNKQLEFEGVEQIKLAYVGFCEYGTEPSDTNVIRQFNKLKA